MSSSEVHLGVRKIYQLDNHHFAIDWNDGTTGKWKLSQLRRMCPCASCVDERTGQRKLDPEAVAENIVCSKIVSAGRYALVITFGDGHSTGIYSFKMLRQIQQTIQ